MPPRLGLYSFRTLQGHRDKPKQAVCNQSQCDMALDCFEGALPIIPQSAGSFDLVEDIFDPIRQAQDRLEPGRIKLQESKRVHGDVCGEEDVHLFARALGEDDHHNGFGAEATAGHDDSNESIDGYRLAIDLDLQLLSSTATTVELHGSAFGPSEPRPSSLGPPGLLWQKIAALERSRLTNIQSSKEASLALA